MTLFATGLILFFVVHVITATPSMRSKLVAIIGVNAWKGVVAIASLGGIALIVGGWSATPNALVFAPSTFAIRFAPVFVTLALILFVIGGGNLGGHIRRNLHHPMLVGAILWSSTHLLANGGLRETLLFGAFLTFSVYALCSLLLAGKRTNFTPEWKWDVIGIVIGLIVATGFMHGHQWLFGVAVA